MRIPGATRLEVHDRLDSTNRRLLEWARQGAPFFAVVVAREQTRGRGRGGKRWISAPDAGLWISVLLPPPPGGAPGVTSMAVGVAAARAVESVAGVEVGLKWPNDLLVPSAPDRPEPGKVGGVLCEVASGVPFSGVVAGIGINLQRPSGPRMHGPPDGHALHLLEGAAFLNEAGGGPVAPEELAATLVRELRTVADPPPDRADHGLLSAWNERDMLRGQEIASTEGVQGRVCGVAPDGQLQVTDEQGRMQRVRGGTVRVLGEGPPALFGGGGDGHVRQEGRL